MYIVLNNFNSIKIEGIIVYALNVHGIESLFSFF